MATLRQLFGRRQTAIHKKIRRNRLSASYNPALEPLEERRLLTTAPFTSYVDDAWTMPLLDGTPVDTSGQPNITPPVSTTFQTAPDGAGPLATAGFTYLADAIANTVSGGGVEVLEAPQGGYSGDINISSQLLVQGAYTLNGSLTVGSQGLLSPGQTAGTIHVKQDLSLTSGSQLLMKFDPTNGSDQIVVDGNIDLGGATLSPTFTSFIPSTPITNFTLIKNNGSNPIAHTFAGLPEGAALTIGSQNFWITYQGGTSGRDVVLISPSSTVAARQLFYAGSGYDKTGAGFPYTPSPFSDDNAIATDKVALLPGAGQATFANLSSYDQGINGIMVDLAGPAG